MADINYRELFGKALSEYSQLLDLRQDVDLRIAKKRQFLYATMNMLPEDERRTCALLFTNLTVGSLGLTDAIRKVLQNTPDKPLTATDVRDKLKETNFDFSSYKTNPLASIHAVLKRLKPEEVEATEIDGVAAWRWVGELPPPVSEATSKWIKSFSLTPSPNDPIWRSFYGQDSEDRESALSRLKALSETGKKKRSKD